MVMEWAAILLFLVLFYNCYWKRRHLPPGPMPWPIIGNIPALKSWYKIPPYDVLNKWRKQYGDIFTVWIGKVPNVCVTEFSLIRDTFIKNGDAYTGRLHFPAMTDIFRGGSYGVVFTDGEEWRKQRRFTLSVLREFGMGKNLMQEKIIMEMENLFEKFDHFAKSGTALFIGQHFDLCVGSIISLILFGFRYEDNRIDDFTLIRSSIGEQLHLHSHPLVVLLFWKANWFKRLPKFSALFQRIMKLRDIMFTYIDNQVQQHMNALSDPKNMDKEPNDFVDSYIREMKRETAENGQPIHFTRDQLRNVVLDLLITGQDTTSLTLGFTVLYILHNDNIQAKIYEELDSLGYGENAFITYDDRNRLPYLNAVLNESQRMTNLLPENLFHKTTRDVVINNYHIPNGTAITPQISCVLYDEKVFPDPKTFRPERFLDENGQPKRVDEFIPFSIGKRSCIGENLARMELFLIISNTFKRYKIKPVDSNNLPSLDKIAGLTVQYKPYNCFLEKRNK